MKTTLGGIRMPSVPPAAIVAVARCSEYPNERIGGNATLVMVAADARLDPEMAAKPPQAKIVETARPPRTWPMNA